MTTSKLTLRHARCTGLRLDLSLRFVCRSSQWSKQAPYQLRRIWSASCSVDRQRRDTEQPVSPSTLTHKLIAAHLIDGDMSPGSDIRLRFDQTLTQDATGTLVMLTLEALGLDRVETETCVPGSCSIRASGA
jgi:hypothetical protein